MSADLTREQRAAVDERAASVVLASGAGCGKTHVLTARYLSHLAADAADVGQVVAITFTERAAREMRGRIRAAVAARVDAGGDTDRWRKHLRNLETAPITTIHSFCGNVLRQHAVAAGLDPRFDVLDETQAATLRADALRHSLHHLLTVDPGSSPADDLRELIVLFGWGAVREAVDGLLVDADRAGWGRWLGREAEDIAAEWLGPARAALLPAWVDYLCAASPKVAGLLTLLGQVPCVGPETRKNVARLLAEVPRLHEATDLATAVAELKEVAKVGKERAKAWPDAATYEAVKAAMEAFRKDIETRFALFAAGPDGVGGSASVGQRFLRVAAAAHDEYRLRKRRAGGLDFHDLLVGARDLLRDRPAVRADLRRRFRFVLLDELQDTDPVQMELVEHLCGDGLTAGKLFAVGDHKQSIYRFRGADVGLFQRLRQSVPDAGRLGLTRNYRSQPGVLSFVNALFGKRVPDYQPLEPHREAAGVAANVEFLWSEPTGDGKADSATEVRRREANAIAQRIVTLLDDPTPRVYVKGGPPRRVVAADVTLLFRSMSHVAIYEAALRRHGLDYYLVGGRAFFAQQEVYDLLNALRAVENPHDGLSLVGALRSPFCNLSDEAITILAAHPDGPWAGLCDPDRVATLPADQRPPADRARRHVERWRELKDRLPVARLLGAMFADTGYDAAMQFEFLGDRKLANLWKLVDLARGFDRAGLFGLHEFAARLADLVARQPREEQAATLPETADVVKLMSIHQSKGLEFPVVIVPDLAAAGRGNVHPVARWDRDLGCLVRLPSEWDEDGEGADAPPFAPFADRLGRTADQLADWAEDLRVLYVACTRAEDLLILSAGLPEPFPEAVPGLPTPFPGKAATHWTLALAERFDPRTGRCVAADVPPDNAPAVRVQFAGPSVNTASQSEVPAEHQDAQKPRGGRPWVLSAPPAPPRTLALPTLERPALAPGEAFDTEDDGDRATWRTPRERLTALSPAERVLWAVLDRWPFADMDAWGQLLADALEDVPDPADARRLADDLRPKLQRFAGSDARFRLAGAHECRRAVAFVADLREFADLPPVRGVIDFLYRDAFGWHLLAVDLGVTDEDDPWRGRRPGLVLQAWAASHWLGEWPASVELYDLSAGQLVDGDPRRVRMATVADHFKARHETRDTRHEKNA